MKQLEKGIPERGYLERLQSRPLPVPLVMGSSLIVLRREHLQTMKIWGRRALDAIGNIVDCYR
jgi:hypothetical protein